MSGAMHKARHFGPITSFTWKVSVDHKTQLEVGHQSKSKLGNYLAQFSSGSKALLIHQSLLPAEAIQFVAESLQARKLQVSVQCVPDGDECKSLQTLTDIWSTLQEKNFDRHDTIIAFGGGSVCDLAGFAASTYMRGTKLVLIPTTLLAQVDAAIGGKTGINLQSGKNLAGTFYFPDLVIVDPEYLSSLPARQIVSGMAEIVKYALIEKTVAEHAQYRSGPRSLLQLLEQNSGSNMSFEDPVLPGIISTCIKMKLAVVGADPQESGLRRCLNLGHTLGHALEKVSDYQIAHGEGVSIGMTFALRLAVERSLIAAGESERAIRLLRALGLPVQVDQNLDKQKIIAAMSQDKKRQGSTIKMVLPSRELGLVHFDSKVLLDELPHLL